MNVPKSAPRAFTLLTTQAIDEIGWTPYHMKLFFLNGFGYALLSLMPAD